MKIMGIRSHALGDPGMEASGIITLTTDFSLRDPYVGIMKGVILSINPKANIIDITHQIKPGDILSAGSILRDVHGFFPQGTIHVAVVDPGVGGQRRPILVKTQNYFLIGPDNGLFWPIVYAQEHTKIIHLTETKYFLSHVSNTFHGRDIFAPVSAHLSLGRDPVQMGKHISNLVQLNFPQPLKKENALTGRVIRVDSFGNLITNIHHKDLAFFMSTAVVVKIGHFTIEGIKETFSQAEEGTLLALMGSSGYLEIAVNLGSACDYLGMDPEKIIGTDVVITKN